MSLTGLLNQTITLYSKTSYNKFGREVVGTGVDYYARVQLVTKSRLLPNGQTVLINLIVYIKPSVTVNINDKVTYDSVDYKVFGVSKPVDGTGTLHHTKLELTRWQET